MLFARPSWLTLTKGFTGESTTGRSNLYGSTETKVCAALRVE